MSAKMFKANNGLLWSLDTHEKFVPKGYSLNNLVQMMGIIPNFISAEENVDTVKIAVERYGFGNYPMTDGKITKSGIYSYPEDPDLYPISVCAVNGFLIYVYEYGMICFYHEESNKWTMYRFD